MMELESNLVSDEGIFCFDEDEEFIDTKYTSGRSLDTKVNDNGKFIDYSRLPINFEKEEIVSILPKKNFNFDIIQTSSWSNRHHQDLVNNNIRNKSDEEMSRLDVLSSRLQNISLIPNNSRAGVMRRESPFSSPQSYSYSHSVSYEEMTTIEGLRIHIHSCFTCGVHWHEEQVSLDCSECGGYALSRPCCDCDGKCQTTWTRDLSQTHSLGKAKWNGTCKKSD